ncbi:MAG: ABC transporter ATP-binding protein [Acidimicrobiales bacterium]
MPALQDDVDPEPDDAPAPAEPALELGAVTLERDGRRILGGISWRVSPGERWVVLGRNGSGKTSLVRIASLYLHPTSGTVRVLGRSLGRTDVRELRRHIGVMSAAMADLVRPQLIAADVVMTARYAALEPWWHEYDEADRRRARDLLGRVGAGHVADQAFGTLSSGERQRVLLARTLMTDPGLLLFDEPMAALDLGAREELVTSLGELAADPATAPIVLVTHHLEEIPRGFTHALLLAGGRVQAAGPLDETLTDESLSDCFGVSVALGRHGDRYRAVATRRDEVLRPPLPTPGPGAGAATG